jgi:hypothetical protein
VSPCHLLPFALFNNKTVMLLSGRPSIRTGRTRLVPRSSLRLAPRAVRPYTLRLARSHQTYLAPRAPAPRATRPCASRLMSCAPTPRASHSSTEPASHCVRLAPRATRLALCSPVTRQLAFVERQQVDEHMLQPYVSYVSDVCCICFI